MKVFESISETLKHRKALAANQKSIGFVPTMGALHRGHLSLVEKAIEENDVVAVSIFVNPIQFNELKDLKNYPRDLNRDLYLLGGILSGDDFVFIPGEDEMYPDEVKKTYDFGLLDKVMEGASRAGHFNGVGIVVNRLFRILEPDKAYFGEKDFQQIAIIQKLVELENLPVQIISCPIIREESGLAMSSRNLLLSVSEKKSSSILHQSLQQASNFASDLSMKEVVALMIKMIESKPGFIVEYIEFVDENTLQSINSWKEAKVIRCFIAVRVGKVRLIDNAKITVASK